MDEYTFLQCIPTLRISMAHSQYISRISGFVHTGISELSMLSYGVWVYRSHCLTHQLLFAKYAKCPL